VKHHPLLRELGARGVRLGLRRLEAFLATIGEPHRSCRFIHVAGTNGKGSVVAMLESMLCEAGVKVGAFTSPHLQRINERFRVNGEEIGDEQLKAILEELGERQVSWFADTSEDAVATEDFGLTYFEMVFAAALVYFARQGVEVAILEVGLGGRLDATNIVDPEVAVITNVGFDHMDILGPDIASIAGEKGGIIKMGRPVVVGPLQPDATRVIRAIAHAQQSERFQYDEAFRVTEGGDGGFTWVGQGTTIRDLHVGMGGDHQIENSAVAIEAARVFSQQSGIEISEDVIRAGLGRARAPGRLEWLAPDLLVDCAHNRDGAMRLGASLREILPESDSDETRQRRTLLLGTSADKDARAIVVALSPYVDRILTTQCSHPRATPAGDLAEQLVDVGVPVLPAGRIEQALPMAREGGGLVIGAGSVFLVGAIRELAGAR